MQITAIYQALDSVLPLEDFPNAACSWIGTHMFTPLSQVFAGRIMFCVRQRSAMPTFDRSRGARPRSTGAIRKDSRDSPMSSRLVPSLLLRNPMHRLWTETFSLRPFIPPGRKATLQREERVVNALRLD